jgi:hypothetical protein
MKKLLYRRRGIFAVLALFVVVAAAVGGTIPFFYGNLPEPAKANRHELLRWLIVKDLAKETPATQLTLAERLEEEFGSGVDWAEFQSKLNDAQRKQLFQNIPCVLRPWILKKAETYEQVAKDQKKAFLDRLLDTLEVWRGVEKLLPNATASGKEPAKSPKLAAILMQEMDKIQKESPVAQQKQIGKFWADVQMQWFLRSFATKT